MTQETAMLPSYRFALAAGLLCLAACQRSADTDGVAPPRPSSAPTPGAGASAPADATPPPAPAAASGADYACADGTRLQVDFGNHDATLRWPGGRSITLPRAESASKGGGDVYVGDTVSLQRDGMRLQLHDGERTATDCAPATPADAGGATADDAIAASYACDAGTRLTRRDDGSFRAMIPGNAPLRLVRIADSRPPVFTGASLYLRIEGNGEAILSQGDRTNELRCTSGQAPA
jgi:hypothetical protein